MSSDSRPNWAGRAPLNRDRAGARRRTHSCRRGCARWCARARSSLCLRGALALDGSREVLQPPESFQFFLVAQLCGPERVGQDGKRLIISLERHGEGMTVLAAERKSSWGLAIRVSRSEQQAALSIICSQRARMSCPLGIGSARFQLRESGSTASAASEIAARVVSDIPPPSRCNP